MKYWRINSELLREWNNWWATQILNELKMFLWNREYYCSDFDKDKSVTAPNNYKFTLQKITNEEENILSILIYNDSEHKVGHGRNPQIVKLIEDYFKLNSSNWYLLETINSTEDKSISKQARNISPLQISKIIKNWEKDDKPQKPKVIDIGQYNYSQTDCYSGSKFEFRAPVDFWISCLYWISSGELEESEFYYQANKPYFDNYCGACIPINESNDEFERVIEYLKKKNDKYAESKMLNSWLMRKNWNDKMYMLEYDNEFVLHHWHTAE